MGTIAENRRARFDYEILERFEAGIELKGFEVKSAKAGRLQLAGAYVLIRGGEAWLLNAAIPPYQPNNTPADYDEKRLRRILLRKSEIKNLSGKLDQKAVTLIPLRAYVKQGLVKLELGLARSKKSADKREALKKKSALREMRRGE